MNRLMAWSRERIVRFPNMRAEGWWTDLNNVKFIQI